MKSDTVKAKILRAFIKRDTLTTSDIASLVKCTSIMRRLRELRAMVRDYGCAINVTGYKRTKVGSIAVYKFTGDAKLAYKMLVEV